MKIVIPEDTSEITLGQYRKYMSLVGDDSTEEETLDAICMGFLDIEDVSGVSVKDKVRLSEKIYEALNTEGIAKDRIKIKGIEYGRITNFDKVVTGEYSDLCKYGEVDKREYALTHIDYENIHRFMSVCYRPVIDKDNFRNYTIESYENTNNADVMNELPLSFVKQTESFFLTLWNDLETHILTYTEGVQKANNRQDILTPTDS